MQEPGVACGLEKDGSTRRVGFRHAQGQGWRGLATAILALLLSTLALVYPRDSAAHAAFPQFLITDYHPVSKTRVPGSPNNNPLYDYVYRVDVRNNGAQAVNVRGSMTSKRRSVAVVDGNASFGTVPARQVKASEDTISVRAGKFFDRRLDRQIFTGGRWRFEEEGYDPEDQSIGGLLGRNSIWLPQLLDAIYDLKFALIFDWSITSGGDSQAPVIANTAPNGNIADARPVISATYSDAQGAIPTNRVTLTVDEVNVTSSATVTATSVSYRPASALPDGSHRVLLTVADSAGNLATATWSFTVDTHPPEITSPAPTNVANASPRATISAQFADETGVDLTSVRLLVDGTDVTSGAITNGNGITYQSPVPLSDGNHTVQLHVADSVGNPADLNWSFGVDASGPSISALQPASGSEIAADALPVISASFADSGSGVDVASIRIHLDNQDVRAQAQVSATGISYTPSVPLTEGSHAVTVEVGDTNGNITSTIWSFVTRTPPQITNVAPSDMTLNANAAVVITAQYTDVGSGIDATGVVLSLDGVDVTGSTQVSASGLSFTPTTALAQGIHIAVLTVRDNAGNTSARTWRFTLDTGLPVVTEQQPKDVLVGTLRPTISAKFADTGTAAGSGIDAAQTRLWVNGTDVTSLAQINTGVLPHQITYTPTQDLPTGSQTVRLKVVDIAGNAVEDVWSFSIDAEGPAIVDLSPADGTTLPADTLITLQGSFVDLGSGVNLSSVTVTLDGQNITAQSTITASGFTRTLTQPLSEGPHTLSVSLRDTVGNLTTRTNAFVTQSAPVISAATPKDQFLPGDTRPTITASLSDIGAGIDVSSIRLYFNDQDVTAAAQITASAVSYLTSQALADGTHTVRLHVVDLAGNPTDQSWEFGTATAPVITGQSPRDVVLPSGSRPTIAATFNDGRVGIDPSKVLLIVNEQDVTQQATVTPQGITYTPTGALAAGTYTVYLEIGNTTNASANSVWGFDVEEASTYSVIITNPAPSTTVDSRLLQVTATAQANKTYPSLLRLNGVEMLRTDSEGATVYSGNATLVDGDNLLTVEATFDDGQVRTVSRTVNYDAPPRVTITSPIDKSVLGRVNPTSPGDLTGNVERPVTITGRISKPAVSVMINQQSAQLLSGGTEFRFDNFYLREGMNVVTAVARLADGRVGSAAVTVSVDQTAPILTVEAPIEQAVTSSAKIDVRGMVNDAVEGFTGASEPTVTVNGRVAQVFDRYYLATDVPLQIGANTLTIVASDQFGNSRSRELTVSRIGVGSDRLTLLSGNHQTGAPVTALPQPFVVVALNAAGEPIPNLPVRFDVMRGTGTLADAAGEPGPPVARTLVLTTNSNGQAQAWFTLGKQSGPGANTVKVSSTQLTEEVTFVATTQRGVVAKVLADTGINQFAETGSQPLEILSVVVRDREDNLLPNIPVVFSVEEGDAFFTDQAGEHLSKVVLNTDKNGLTAIRPTIGNMPGTVRIMARALREVGGDIDNPDDLAGNASYFIQAKQAQNGPASFSGFIYTDKGEPLPGVRVSIGRTSLSSTTDTTGAFDLGDVPPGRVDLFVDGRTSSHLGKIWPSLHFESYVVRGQENELPHPIYLPPLLMTEAKVVGGNEDVDLTIPGLAGFRMRVKANSVTFPDGSRTGTLVVSPVTADRLPMAPPTGGALFGVPAWTIQPAGTRFDPPIEVRLPNASSQPPGDNLPVVQWDHDLGQYVPMGRATVSEDGAFLITDAGSGITKAGWGGLCIYDPDKCSKDKPPECNMCEELDTQRECPTCVYDPLKEDRKEREQVGVTIEPGAWKDAITSGAKVFGLPLKELKLKLVIAAGRTDLCCRQRKSLAHEVSASLTTETELVAEGPIKRLPYFKTPKILVEAGIPEIEIGVFVKGKVFINGGGRYAGSTCTNEMSYDVIGSGGLSLEVAPKITVKPAPPYGKAEAVPIAAGLAGGLSGQMNKAGWKVSAFGTAFIKAEFTFDSRKYTLLNESVTIQEELFGSGSDAHAVEAATSAI